jgi:hypothetical protein
MEGKELILCYEGPKAVDEVNWARKRKGGNKRGPARYRDRACFAGI